MASDFQYLVYDIETCTDKKLLRQVLYPDMDDSEAAYQKHLAELSVEGRDFVNPAFHEPVYIAVLGLNSQFEILKIGLLGHGEHSPEALVRHFWELYNQSRPVLVDFNGKGFDLRVLELWAFRLGISIHSSHYEKFGVRYRFSEDRHLDLHEFLTNYGAIRFRGGLDLFAKILGKPGKMDTKGDMVQTLHDQGNQFQIDDYCLGDVMDTYFVFLRTLVVRGILTLKQEQELDAVARLKMQEKLKNENFFESYLARLDSPVQK